MLNNIIKCLVLLSSLMTLPIHGFWWRSTTTEAPVEPAMQQIPLTYFRTYTYQPMAGNPLPFPLMSSTDYITNYAALANNPYFNQMMSIMPQGQSTAMGSKAITGNEIPMEKFKVTPNRPLKRYAAVRSVNSGYVTPPTTTSTTTTTTTTTPKPTTTTTTTVRTTTTTTPAPTTTTKPTTTSTTENSLAMKESDSASSMGIKTDSLVNIDSTYPAFNRKVYTNHFNINYNRPVYPFPEYSVYKSSDSGNSNEDSPLTPFTSPTISTPTNVEFVPCMCPVNIQGGYPSGMPLTGNPSNSIFLAQGRTNADVEAETELPTEVNEETVDDLQVITMDDDEEAVTPSNIVVS